ncbi:MAG: hypothetical protein ACI8X3_000055, partial [Saprospiraceae bacterium]
LGIYHIEYLSIDQSRPKRTLPKVQGLGYQYLALIRAKNPFRELISVT